MSAAHPGKNLFEIKSPFPGKAKLNQKRQFCGVGICVPSDETTPTLQFRNSRSSVVRMHLRVCCNVSPTSDAGHQALWIRPRRHRYRLCVTDSRGNQSCLLYTSDAADD